MRAQIHFLAIATALSLACSSSVAAATDESTRAVAAALNQVESWLGSGTNAANWEAYLQLPVLREQIAKGDQADRAAVEAVQKQLASRAAGLELEPFAKLREAVDAWSADLAIAQAPSLSEAALAAASSFRPITDADVSKSKAALQAAAAKLGKYLSGSNGAAWKKFLLWDDLEAQLQTDAPNVETLATIYQRFIANQPGLEMAIFANVGDAIERYVNDLTGRGDALQTQLGEQLKSLAEALKTHQQEPTDENALAIGGRLGWLTNMRQSPALVRVIRERHAQPNLHVVASARLVGAGVAQDLDESTPVRDHILGTRIRGTGHLVGTVHGELVESDQRAILDTMLNGTVHSKTVGYNGPATIHARGTTSLSGRKRIVIDAKGFASYPATAAANTSTQVTGIGGSGLVQRVAWRRVGEQKGEAQRIAAAHAADRVRQRMNEEIGAQLSKSQADFQAKFRNPLLRRRVFPDLDFRTTKEHLLLTALAANRSQIAASVAPPEVTVENDLAVRVHESLVNNMAASLFGGRTLTEEEMQKTVIELRGSLPDSLKSEEDRDPWSITFAKVQPVTVKFADSGLQITVRGQKYTSGERDFRAMNVTADYKFQIEGSGIKLARQGDLKIVPPGEPRRLSGKEITLRTLLEKRFGKLFEPEVKYEGLVLPGRWREAGILDLKQAAADKGWFVLAWFESGVPAPPEEGQEQQKPDRVTRAPQS